MGPFWTRANRAAVGLVALAAVVALGGLAYGRHSQRLIEEAHLQAVLSDAYLRRSMDCMDLAKAHLSDPASLDRAEKTLRISRGLTLCLVKARDRGRVDAEALAACASAVEAENTVIDIGDASVPHPAC